MVINTTPTALEVDLCDSIYEFDGRKCSVDSETPDKIGGFLHNIFSWPLDVFGYSIDAVPSMEAKSHLF